MEDEYIFVNFKNYDIIKKKRSFSSTTKSEHYLKIGSIETSNFLTSNKVILPIAFNKFYNDILNAYKDNDNILKQFVKDSKRIKYIVNGHNINDSESLLDYFKYKFNDKLIHTIMLLCTQSVMAMPLEILQTNIIDKNYFIFEPDEHTYKKFTINIKIVNSTIYFKIFKNFRIVNFCDNHPTNQYYVHLKQEFDIYQHSNKFVFPQYMLLHIFTKKTIKDL